MSDSPSPTSQLTTNVSFIPLTDRPRALRRLDEAFAAVERTRQRPDRDELALRQSTLEFSDGRLVVVEAGTPMVTLYLAPGRPNPRPERKSLAPLRDLANFWRIWRPPLEFLHPDEIDWLGEDHQWSLEAIPPVPARRLDSDGWHDPAPDDLDPLAEVCRQTAHALGIDAAA